MGFFEDMFYSEGFQNFLSIRDSFQMFTDSVVHGTEWELDSINKEAEELYKKTKKRVKKTKSKYSRALNEINEQRIDVAETTLKTFSDNFSSLKNVEFEDISISSSKIDIKEREVELSLVMHEAGLADLLIGIPAGGVGAWLVREFKLMDEVDEAKKELGRLIEECAVVKRKCSKIKSVTHFLHTTNQTVSILKEFGDMYNEMLKNIIITYGSNFSRYDSYTRQQIRTIYNAEMALNYFVTKSVVTSAGKINKKYKKYITGISENRDETEKYLSAEDFYLEDK